MEKEGGEQMDDEWGKEEESWSMKKQKQEEKDGKEEKYTLRKGRSKKQGVGASDKRRRNGSEGNQKDGIMEG